MTDTQTPQATPQPVEWTTDNGLTVIFLEDRFAPVVAFQMWMGVGSADERPEEAGLAHVLEHMLFKGTDRRGVGEIARDVEGAGGDINAWTSHDETVYHLVMPSAEFDRGLDILADAVQHSAFDPDELANELEVIREEIKRGKDSPQRRLSEELFRLAFSTHPYRNPIIGSDESVRSFTREAVHGFYRRWYTPPNMTLVVVGDADEATVRRETARLFDQAVRNPPERIQAEEPPQTKPRGLVLPEDVKQSHLALCFPIPSINIDEIPALEALAVILGQGDSSRLTRILQREHELVTDIYAYPYPAKTAGLFMVEAELVSENLETALERMAVETFRIATDGIDEAELTKAKTILENEAIFQAQTVQGKARRFGYFKTHTGDWRFFERYMTRVRDLSVGDLEKAAQRYLKAATANLALLWPREKGDAPNAENLLALVAQAEQTARPAYTPIPKADAFGIVRAELPNGIRVIVKPNHAAPLVSFQAALLGGLRYEHEAPNGLFNLTARLLTLGNARMSAAEIAEAVDGMGGGLSGFSGRNTLGIKGSCISRDLDRGFAIFADCLLTPTFPDRDVEREIMLIKEELNAQDEQPARLAFDLFHETLYRTHPFRLNLLGTADSLDTLTPAVLAENFTRSLQPDRLVLTLVGDVDPTEALRLVERRFGKLESTATAFADPPAEPPLDAPREAKRSLDKQQTHLILGFPGLTFGDNDRHALSVLNAILSGQGGRLFLQLRDRQSLCYSVSSLHLESLDPGYFAVYIGTSPDKRQTAVDGMLGELARILEGDLADEEVQHAKRLLIGTNAISLQTNGSQAGQILLNELYDVGYDAHLTYPDAIAAVTREDVLSVAKRLITLDRYALVEVGP